MPVRQGDPMKKVVTIGEILVEIMATDPGDGFLEPIPLVGPFPSGAPAIFIDQAAKLGQPCGIIGCVGDDDFGRLNLDRLARDGADVSAIAVHPDAPDRQRLRPLPRRRRPRLHLQHPPLAPAAPPAPRRKPTRLIDARRHLHVMGSSLSTPAIVDLAFAAADRIKAARRHRLLRPQPPRMRSSPPPAPARRWTACSPSPTSSCRAAPSSSSSPGPRRGRRRRELLARGIRAVVVKNGAAGATCHDAGVTLAAPAFAVEEVDPTGAGDTFAATFVTHWLRGTRPGEALRLANASGALAVIRKGPMEGTSTAAEIEAFLARSTP